MPVARHREFKTVSSKEMYQRFGNHAMEAAKKAVAQVAVNIIQDAKSRAFVRTGRLRNSLKMYPNRDGTKIKIVDEAKAYNKKKPNGIYYASIIEFAKKRKSHPFLYPARKAHSQEIRDALIDALRSAIAESK